MSKMKVYVAGPITRGDQLKNIAGAIHVAEELLQRGFVPFCPHAMSILWHMHYPKEHRDWLAYDLAWVEACDFLLRIPGESVGADMEVDHAAARGIPVFSSIDDLMAWHRGHAAESEDTTLRLVLFRPEGDAMICGPLPEHRDPAGRALAGGPSLGRFLDRHGRECTCTPAGAAPPDIAVKLNADDPRHRFIEVDGIEVGRRPLFWVLSAQGPDDGPQGQACPSASRPGFVHHRWELVEGPEKSSFSGK